jgi:hypothetical protein
MLTPSYSILPIDPHTTEIRQRKGAKLGLHSLKNVVPINQTLFFPKEWVFRPTEVWHHDQYLFRQDPTSEPKAQKRNRRNNMTHTTLS